jgi:hypothetical protein
MASDPRQTSIFDLLGKFGEGMVLGSLRSLNQMADEHAKRALHQALSKVLNQPELRNEHRLRLSKLLHEVASELVEQFSKGI